MQERYYFSRLHAHLIINSQLDISYDCSVPGFAHVVFNASLVHGSPVCSDRLGSGSLAFRSAAFAIFSWKLVTLTSPLAAASILSFVHMFFHYLLVITPNDTVFDYKHLAFVHLIFHVLDALVRTGPSLCRSV